MRFRSYVDQEKIVFENRIIPSENKLSLKQHAHVEVLRPVIAGVAPRAVIIHAPTVEFCVVRVRTAMRTF